MKDFSFKLFIIYFLFLKFVTHNLNKILPVVVGFVVVVVEVVVVVAVVVVVVAVVEVEVVVDSAEPLNTNNTCHTCTLKKYIYKRI